VVAAKLAQASWVASTRRHRLLLEHLGRPKWAWLLLAHPCLLNTPPFALFCWFFFRNVTELYELHNDTCFLSVMSRNFTDYATIPPLTSEMLRNFMDCAIMLPFDSWHVAELHGLPNDGCQVPRNGQAKVASHQTDGPQTKLGYDSWLCAIFFYNIF